MLTANYLVTSCAFRTDFQPIGLFEEFSDVQPIDAPENIAAGSFEWYDFYACDGGCPLPSSTPRGKS